MGKDIHVRVVIRNRETDLWKQVKLYRKEKGKFKLIEVYPFHNHELFEILSGNELYESYPMSLIHLPESLKQEIKEYQNELGCFDFNEINLADLKLYARRVPKIRDWDYEENHPKAWKKNPVKHFIKQIESYVNLAEENYWNFIPDSDIKILYWFDC